MNITTQKFKSQYTLLQIHISNKSDGYARPLTRPPIQDRVI